MSFGRVIAAPIAGEMPKGIIVGIDIGMTYTGVAVSSYDNVGNAGPVDVIKNWPGLGEQVFQCKVPTKVTHRAGGRRIHSWGFMCPSIGNIEPGTAVKDMFKFHLDRHVLRDRSKSAVDPHWEFEDVKSWFIDFLTPLHDHVFNCLQETWPDFDMRKVECIFGVPTSWNDIRLLEVFRQIVDDTSFCEHRVIMRLTEAEASAVFTAKSLGRKFPEGENFIVCDAGGGTTDICALKVAKVNGVVVELETLDESKSLPVGSLNIDDRCEKKIAEDLSRNYPNPPEHAAHQIAREDFQAIKLRFGKEISLLNNKIRVPGLPDTERIDLPQSDIKEWFDEQIRKIIEFINQEIDSNHGVILSYLVLAGGLGSSTYVQDEITRYYSDKNIKVLYAKEPEELPLAVCKGLVIDRLQHICHHTSVIPIQNSGVSYGILYSERYSKKHAAQRPVTNLLDGYKYATGQIDWIFCRGQKLTNTEPIMRRYSRIISPTNPNDDWKFGVVMSKLEPGRRPDSLDENGGVEIICYAVSDSGPSPLGARTSPKRNFIWRKRSNPLRVDYQLFVFVEPGQLRFEARVIVDGEPVDQAEALKLQWLDDPTAEDRENGYGFQDGLIKGL